MRKLLPVITACVTALVVASLVWAQPSPGFSKTAPISGTGSSGAPLKITACLAGSAYVSNGTTFDCALAGDITAVTAGTGISGGATSGAATVTLNMAGASCGAGSAVTAISATGTGTCSAVGVSDGDKGDITVSSSGTVWNIDADTVTGTELNLAGTTCTGQFISAIDSNGAGTCTSEVGDVSSVVAGTGLVTGGTSGAVTVDVACGSNLSCAADSVDLATNVTMGGNLTSTAGTTKVGDFRGTVITPSTTGTLNDWAPTGYATATAIFITQTGGTAITGLAGGAAGRIVTIVNTSESNDLQIYDDNAGSTAANRIGLPGNPALAYWTLDLDSNITLMHDGTRWTAIAVNSELMPALQVQTALSVGGNTSLGDNESDAIYLYGKPHATGTAPSLSSCGTSPTISGNDKVGTVTVGTGSPTACTLTFSGSWLVSAPICVVSARSASVQAYLTASSTSAITVTLSAGTSSLVFDYHCVGWF